MEKPRGFRLGRRIVKVFGCFVNRRKRTRGIYYTNQRLGTAASSSCASRAITKLCRWGKSSVRLILGLGIGSNKGGLCFGKQNSGYIRVGEEEQLEQVKEVASVPKGHLAVYVGEKNDDACRVFVPVIYFNHPLFAELLRDAEQVYGFDHQGGIQIPCQKSKFENVKMRIAAAASGGGSSMCRGRRSWRQLLVASGGGSDNLDH